MTPANASPRDTPLVEQRPEFDAAAPLQFVINGKAGSSDTDDIQAAVESALQAAGRTGQVRFAGPGELDHVARDAAAQARRDHGAVVAVGGDGTINTVAQVAHDTECAMGVIPQGTFNYFAREHGVPTDVTDALRWLLSARPEPARVAAINDRLFLVNASVGLYPELLQDRERWEERFGRSRLLSVGAGFSTLLRARAPLRVRVTSNEKRRELRTVTLFIGYNRLQLEKLGFVESAVADGSEPADHHLTAVMLRPIGTLAMLGLMLRGAMGRLASADNIEHFPCEELVMEPASARGRQVKVAYDGEVTWMRAPIVFRVLPNPLWLLKAPRPSDA